MVCIHSFSKHLLRVYYVTETNVSTGENEIAKNKTSPSRAYDEGNGLANSIYTVFSAVYCGIYNHRVLIAK